MMKTGKTGIRPRRGQGGIIPAALPVLLLAGLLVCAGCSGPRAAPHPVNFTVAVTVLPVAEFVKAVGGDRTEVIVVVPPGADPHTYEVTPGQMAALSGARIYFKTGNGLLPFEDRFTASLVGINRDIRIVDSSAGIEYISEAGVHGAAGEYGKDPHVWLSVSNAEVMVTNIASALSDADPGNSSYYAANRDAYLDRLAALDTTLNVTLSILPQRKFIVAHDAWGYFAREYNLTQVPVEAEGKEPGAREIGELVTLARREGITVVFVEPQFSPRGAEVIAREINGTVVSIDPLAPDYYNNMIRVSRAFAGSAGQ